MDTSSPKARTARPGYGRRFVWLGAFVVLLFGGYSAGWLYFAGLLQQRTQAAIAEVNADAVSAKCTNPIVRGFPFRLGVHCDSVAFADASRGIRMSAGSFRSAGRIYDPTRLVAELDGPASIELPETAPLAVDWRGMRASMRLAEPMPERVSVVSTALTAKLGTGTPLARLASFEAHLRPNGGDLDLAARFEGLEFEPAAVAGRRLPALSGHADLSVSGGVTLAQSGVESLRGQSGTMRTLALSTGPDTGLTASGPFWVGADGLLDADLTLTVRDPKGLSETLSDAFPEARLQIETSLSGLAALGPQPTLPLKIVRGKATLGFIPLGFIPPL